MKDFRRNNTCFSLCGLNCGLCSMRLSGHCPGCGGEGQHSCSIAKCSLAHGGIAYCFLCDEFPCAKYENAEKYDSFITHQNQFLDIQKAQDMGLGAYTDEQIEKAAILKTLLENYNAGRQKAFFCIAVNLLDIRDVKAVMAHLASNPGITAMGIKDKAAYAVRQFQALADKQGVLLKLRKKPSDK